MWNKIKSFVKSMTLPIFYQGGFSVFSSGNKVNKDFYYGIVMRCIDVISTNVANNDFDLYRDIKGKGERVELNTHRAYTLLQRPNSVFTNHDLFYLTMAHILTGGAAYWYLPRNLKNEVAEIWPLPPDKVIVIKGDGEFIKGYIYINPAGKRVEIPIDQILPIYRPNPFDWWKGVNTLEAARYEADSDLSAIQWNSSFFKHGAIPSGTLNIDAPLDKEKAEIIRDNLKELYTGKDNAHKVMVLGRGQTFSQLAPKQKEMDFVGQRTFSRDEILAIFNVPKSVIGITDDVNRANAEVADYVFAKRNIKVWLGLIFEKLNTFYLPLFKDSQGLYFDYEDPTPEDRTQKLEEHKASVNVWMTINEVRAERNLEPIQNGDVLYMPFSLVPALQDQNVANPQDDDQKDYQKRIMKKKGIKNSDRVYLINKRKIVSKYQTALNNKMKQHFGVLIKDIKKQKIEKSFEIIKTKGSEQVISFLKPILDNWEVLTAKILINFGTGIGEEAINLNDKIYNIPKVDMSSIVPLLKKRSDDTADSVANSVYDRAREIIARDLEQDILDPKKIVDDIAEALDDETGYRSERIMRTEISYSFNAASIKDFEASGFVEQMKWLIGDDPCEECKKNDDEIIDVGDSFSSGDTEPPVHPNCECDVVPVF